jgi:hypothetical protein
MNRIFLTASFLSLVALAPVLACSSESTTTAPATPVADGGAGTGDSSPGTPTDPGKGGFLITASGEDLANVGYDWNTSSLADGDPPAFVDGWQVRFKHVIVTLANIKLSEDPDKDPGAPDNVGATVAEYKDPVAVDLVIGGNLVGKSGSADEKAIAITSFAARADGKPFDPSKRYAFGYDTVAASDSAKLLNLDAAGLELYKEAKAKGYAMIFQGEATYKGPAGDGVFAKMPGKVTFNLGFKNASSYINCQNADLQKVGDEFPRGLQPDANKSVTAQITIHTDHAFWNKLNVEGTPMHFDPIAANSSTYGTAGSEATVSNADLDAVDITGFKTKTGEALPARSLVSDYTAPAGQLKFDANGTSFSKANSFAAFLSYSAASGGHLNADGECEVKNNFTP